MKKTLSTELISLLENFSTINNQFLFNPGNYYKTCDPNRGIFAVVKLEEEFPVQFPIHDLSNFIKCLKIADNPELEVTESLAVIKNDKLKIQYRSSNIQSLEKRMVDFTAKSTLKVQDFHVELLFTQDLRNRLQKLRDLNDNDILHILTTEEKITFYFKHSSNGSVFELELFVENAGGKEFFVEFDKLKFYPTNYRMKVSDNMVIFSTYDVSEDGKITETDKIKYYIANRKRGI